MKKWCCLIGLLLCVTLLWGCSKEEGGKPGDLTVPATAAPETTQDTLPVETTLPEVTVPQTLPPEEPTLPWVPVTEYPQLEFDSYATPVPVSDTKVAMSVFRYGDEEVEQITLHMTDLITGTVTAVRELGQQQSISVQQILGGRLLVEDSLNLCYLVLDEQLHQVQSIPVPRMFGWFTADLQSYFYLEGQTLMVLDTASGMTAAVEYASRLRISHIAGFDSDTGVLLCSVYTDPYSFDTCCAALSVAEEKLVLMTDLYGFPQFSALGICVEQYNQEREGYDLYWYEPGMQTLSRLPAEMYEPENGYGQFIEGSDYVIVSSYDPMTMEDTGSTVYRWGQELCVSPELTAALPDGSSVTVLPDGSWLCGYMEDRSFRLKRICPDQFTFETVGQCSSTEIPVMDEELAGRYEKILAGPELPEELAYVRQLADDLEEEFGITVLLSGQCQEPAAECSFPITTTDQAEWMDESWYIADALHILRRTLELYPEGFFEQFRRDGNNGILVLLVEDIQSDNNAIGVSYYMNNWYPIAVDITSYDLMSTYCHELWHATENFINNRDYSVFNDGSWEEMNPDGFGYSYDTGLGYIYETDWTYFDGWYGTQSYFVDSYARTNAKEDRARLMEYLMAYDEETRTMMEAPALYEKTGYLCQAIRESFDTEGWENVWWERYHGIAERE